MEAWARLPNETAKAHAAFMAYCEMDNERSTAKVAQKLSKSKTIIDRWSSRHDWIRRCAEYDAALAELDFADVIRARREAKNRHRRIARLLLAKVEIAANRINPRKLTASAAGVGASQ